MISERVERINIWRAPENELEDTGEELTEVYHIFTVYTVNILYVYKGNLEIGETIDLRQMGGEYGRTTHIHSEEVNISKNDDLILFLENFGDMAVLVNPVQAIYFYSPPQYSGVHYFESVNPNNDLYFTLDDLYDIIENR